MTNNGVEQQNNNEVNYNNGKLIQQWILNFT